ncbi:hypothetical protein KY290_001602 [Solanum tuberosum]|uniref:Retrotransposon gag domain-containing protein n=1 Tax=Solanum tuberosum TaxID=4113 RepID=A0ABQ7WMQ8_SOLTU|nr:hypothetical protein KY290_001602 [Solanum tuberosum]
MGKVQCDLALMDWLYHMLSWIGCTVAVELMSTIINASHAKQVWIEFKELFDRSNLIRIYHLWIEIAILRQGMDHVTTYYSQLKNACHELDIMAPLLHCDCGESWSYLEHLRSQRLLQFLMGLNESYSQIRSSILARTPIVIVNEAYATVTQEESQRTLCVVDDKNEVLTLLAWKSQSYRPSFKKELDTSNGPQRFDLFCECCGYRNHKKDNCYRLVGYPPGFQSKMRDNNNDGAGHFRPNGGIQGDRSNSFGNNQNHTTGYRPQGRGQHNSGRYRPAAKVDSSGIRPQANTSHIAESSSSKGQFLSDQQYDELRQMLGRKAHLNTHQIYQESLFSYLLH